MTVNFQAQIDYSSFPKVKVFVEDLYPGADSFEDAVYFENDPSFLKDEETGRLYQFVEKIDFDYTMNMSNDCFYSVIRRIDQNIYVQTHSDGGYGQIKYEDIPSFKRKVIKALNSSTEVGVCESSVEGNFFHCGVSNERIVNHLRAMLIIISNAQERKLNIFWA